MATNNNIHHPTPTNPVKKHWQEPTIVMISSGDVEKNALATKESIAPGAFTPKSQYHS